MIQFYDIVYFIPVLNAKPELYAEVAEQHEENS